MMRYLFILFGICSAFAGKAQYLHGNEWIDYSRQYWSFKTNADRTIRIDINALTSAGFPVTSVDPRHIMVFNREKQVPIYIQGENDGEFNETDFIEFRTYANDAWLDAKIFSSPSNLANPYFSYFNDTIRYYLTYDPDPATIKERIVPFSFTNADVDPLTPRPWAYTDVAHWVTTRYYPGAVGPNGGTSGFYTEGEGYFSSQIMNASAGNTAEQTATLNTPRLYIGADAPAADVSAVVVSINNDGQMGHLDHHLQVSYGPTAPGVLAVDTIFNGFKIIRSQFQVPPTELGTNIVLRFKAIADLNVPVNSGVYSDRQTFSNASIRYARDFTLNNTNFAKLIFPHDPSSDHFRLDIATYTGTPIIYAIGDSVRRILPISSGGIWRALIPQAPGGAETVVLISRQQVIFNQADIALVSTTGYFTDPATLLTDSAMLIVTHETLMSSAQAYATYRQNSLRNPVNTLLMDVNELYDQFGGGIPKHPLAIRRFCKYILDHNQVQGIPAPSGLFLIGKSVQAHRFTNDQPSYRPDISGAYANCLVPSFGSPPSDPCFGIGLNFNPTEMTIPVGRLSARSTLDVDMYLEKVQSFESQPRAAWMKNILHFRGGLNPGDNEIFSNAFAPMKHLAEDTCFGGRVTTFAKTSVGVFQAASADSVRMFIEDEDKGVTLMNFFAHAYADGFDITIDDPVNYQWQGKYPFVIGNSCYIGNVHLNTATSIPERWVMLPDQGAIGFLASVDIGYAQHLAQYTTGWYRSFSQANYAKGVGSHMQYTAGDILQSPDLLNQNTVHTFTLQGDPSLVLNSFEEPDYSIHDEDITFMPSVVTADQDSFMVKAVVTNIGKAVRDSIVVELERNAPFLGPAQISSTTLGDVFYQDTAYFTVPTQANTGGQGWNIFKVKVDLEPNMVPEMEDSTNNTAMNQLFITSGHLVPAYPYDFAIVPDPNPMLKASTGDPLAPERTYIFEIDTTDLFNSPIKEMTMIEAPGGVVSWQPASIYALNSFQDSTVFYWRCSIDSTGNGGYNWYERSFQYITGKNGWGQAHYFQFKNDHYAGVVYDRPNREFDFYSDLRHLRAEVAGNATGTAGWGTKYVIDLSPMEYGNGCTNSQGPAWFVAVIDPYTFIPWSTYHSSNTSGPQYGNINNGPPCRDRPERFFHFPMNNVASMDGMANMINAAETQGHHLLIFTWRYLQKNMHPTSLIAALEGIGLPSFAALPDSVPMIMYVKNGNVSTYQDTLGSTITSDIMLSLYVDGSTDRGFITTMEAGPALSWHKLYWHETALQPSDSTGIILQGIPPGENSAPVDLLSLDSSLDEWDLTGLVSAQEYPKLRLRGHFFDIGNPDPDPAQIRRWQLLNEPAPECAIHPPLGYHNALNDLQLGQESSIAVAVQNISNVDMDSLLMTAWVVDRNNISQRIHYKVNAPLPAGAFLMDTVRFSTLGLGGPNTLIIEANPIDTITGVYHQVEQYHFNNIVQVRFLVDEDITNPLLDVTFDGVHILDGDIVSARPEILITLDDENPVLLLDSPADTANFKVFLTTPGGAPERLYFRDGAGVENMQFIPASGPKNEAKILYRPVFQTDGEYQLGVEAADQSNNQSGNERYSINFEVINRPTITEVLNYPNPFTTSTRFVFTVTGHQTPTFMRIQILTVTGRVVREIGMHELGQIRIGRNITEYAWDGTDQFGDRLARGVYLYRVIAKLNGEDIEHRQTSADQYFHKGFGKMYLLK